MQAARIDIPGAGRRSDPPATGEREESGPLRRCIATGQVGPKAELLRFVVGPDVVVVPDLSERLPGRGFWLLARRNVVDKARARNLFARAARSPVVVPEDLADRVAGLLRERCLGLIGLARRAGQIAVGHDKVRGMLARGESAALLQASDGAAGGRRKLAALGRGHRADLPVIELFAAGELGQAVGRDAVVHMAIAPGRLAERLIAETQRLAGLAGDEANETVD